MLFAVAVLGHDSVSVAPGWPGRFRLRKALGLRGRSNAWLGKRLTFAHFSTNRGNMCEDSGASRRRERPGHPTQESAVEFQGHCRFADHFYIAVHVSNGTKFECHVGGMFDAGIDLHQDFGLRLIRGKCH